MEIAVALDTGLIGRTGVMELRAAEHDPVALARSPEADLITGAGLSEELSGCRTVIDIRNVVTTKNASVVFFLHATKNLLAAAQRARLDHLIALSVVGSNTAGFGYYFGKCSQKKLVVVGCVPWTILRATQMFDFPEQLIANHSSIAMAAWMLLQPVVVAALSHHVGQGAAGYAPDLAGPAQLQMVDVARRVITAGGQRRLVLRAALPNLGGKDMCGVALLPRDDYARGHETFEQHLVGARTTAGR
ncbi:SDR family oxidoreductase [Saccharopolyspora sp. 5N708]|uniref:SDR family oxidoreductase n=1 Tax=Saccharopolyspora sp. 5N708 TaxID=3457424 RepID=UPI003FD11FC0